MLNKRDFRNIVVCTNPGRLHGSKLLQGVTSYAQQHDWAVHCISDFDITRKDIFDWRFDGIIGMISDETQQAVIDRGTPYVCLRRNPLMHKVPTVLLDDIACGEIAANHLLDRGLVHFVYGGELQTLYGIDRSEGFERTLRSSGRCASFQKWDMTTIVHAYNACCFRGESPDTFDLDWLRDSPHPLGVFLMFDPLAFRLASLCRVTGIRVPEDVAILGVHDAEITCNMAVPTLSSVASPAEQLGYLAAQALDREMTQKQQPPPLIELPPLGVTERQSTAITHHKDELINRATAHIRIHAPNGLSVQQLVDYLTVSRRHLERQFKSVLGRTPLEEIHRVRLRHALELLSRRPEMTISQVADASGYSRNDQLAKAVREYTGRTPKAYRKLYFSNNGNTTES